MKSPTRAVVAALLQTAHDAGRCFAPHDPAQRRLLNRAVDCGIALRIVPGVFAPTVEWESLDPNSQALRLARTLSLIRPTWVFAGPTAALAHGLWTSYRSAATLCRIAGKSSHRSSSSYTRLIHVHDDTPVVRNEVRVTSFLRTVYDCLRLLPFPEALAVADSVLRTKGVSRERLADNLKRIYAHMPGIQRALAVVELADEHSENGGESMARAQMISLGFVPPDLQVEIGDPLDPNKSFRQDFAWRLSDDTLVIGELDGHEKYVDPDMTLGQDVVDVLLAERRREAHLTLQEHHVRVMRFSFAESQNRPYFEQLLASYGIPRAAATPDVALM